MKRYAAVLAWLLLLAGAVCISACGKTEEANQRQRIVVLSPEVAEIIAALGAVESLVGVTRECDYPPELSQIKQVGNFGAVDKEAILALNPSLVFTSALEQEALTQDLEKMGLTVKQVYPKKLDDLPLVVEEVGNLIGRQKEAVALAYRLRLGIQEMRARTAGVIRPKVYLEIYRDPLMSVSDASFVGELIETAGGDNIFSTLERDYARVSSEDIVSSRPDIIICYSRDSLESIRARKGWQDIPAIQNGRIYTEADIDPDLIQRAAPRILEGLERLNRLFFP